MLSGSHFNQQIGSWDVSKGETFVHMFYSSQFNQPVGSWNVSQGETFESMFYNASEFSQDLSSWIVTGKGVGGMIVDILA
jgi:hypothetical protein